MYIQINMCMQYQLLKKWDYEFKRVKRGAYGRVWRGKRREEMLSFYYNLKITLHDEEVNKKAV